jgi:hypothetical protein
MNLLAVTNRAHNSHRASQRIWFAGFAIMPVTMRSSHSNPWEDYRARRAWFVLAFVLWIPLNVFIAFPLYRHFDSDVPIYLVASLGMGFFMIAGFRLNAFRCPRCRKPFFHTLLFSNGFARRCLHCGLPKWCDETSTE